MICSPNVSKLLDVYEEKVKLEVLNPRSQDFWGLAGLLLDFADRLEQLGKPPGERDYDPMDFSE